jgi:hypothetical protein
MRTHDGAQKGAALLNAERERKRREREKRERAREEERGGERDRERARARRGVKYPSSPHVCCQRVYAESGGGCEADSYNSTHYDYAHVWHSKCLASGFRI